MATAYRIPLILVVQPEGGYMVTSPALPHFVTQGDTAQAALTNAGGALDNLLEDQAWFWTEEWQEGEAEVDRLLAAGQVEEFATMEEFLSSLGLEVEPEPAL